MQISPFTTIKIGLGAAETSHITERAATIEKRLGHFADESSKLLVTVAHESSDPKTPIVVKLEVTLPRREALHAEGTANTVVAAFDFAEAAMLRQIDKLH